MVLRRRASRARAPLSKSPIRPSKCGVQFFQSVRSADYLPKNICRLVRNRALLTRWKHLHFTEGHCEKVPQCLGPQPDFEKFLRSQIILMRHLPFKEKYFAL